MDMKRVVLLPLFALLFSCGGTTSKYEKMIADIVQTDGGMKHDLNFKVENLEEIRQISVADSINIISDDFHAGKEKMRQSLQRSIDRNQENLEKEKENRHPGQSMMSFYQKNIDIYSHQLDSLERATSPELAKYENRNQSEILAVVVRCTYSVNEPLTQKRVSETFDFVFSPDATKFYSKKRVRE